MFKKISICIILFLIPFLASAQGQFIYEYTNNIRKKSFNFILAIEQNESFFNTLSSIEADSYIDEAIAKGETVSFVGKNTKGSSFITKVAKFDNQLFRYVNISGAKVVVISPALNSQWKLLKETKQTDNHILQKASVLYGGREWIAWYNPNIPIQEGPYVFSGLPGLIEEIHDTENIHHFRLRGKSKKDFDLKYIKPSNTHLYTKVSNKRFNEILVNAVKNPFEHEKAHGSFISTVNIEITPERIQTFNRIYRKKLTNGFIERLSIAN